MKIKIIDVPLYYGCDNPGTHLGPMAFSKNNISSLAERCGNQVSGISLIGIPPKPENKNTEPTMKYLEEVTATCRQLADSVQEGFAKGSFPFVVGGDHSLGIGSIAGLSRCIPADQLSVVWIDAHTDINTNLTSESHYIHGMPLAACLGLSDSRLYETTGSASPFLLAQNLFYIGSRSVDEGEEVILAENNIRTIRMPQIQQNGIEACCREILQQINTPYIHLSFDVDFMDAAEFSATGLPIPDGPSIEQTHQALRVLFSDPRVCSADFVEYSPKHDRNDQGLHTCLSLMENIFTSLAQSHR